MPFGAKEQVGLSSVRSQHRISQNTQSLDLHFDHVTGFEEEGRPAERSDSFGCSGRNDVAWLQSNTRGNELNEFWNVENHFARVGVLQRDAVHARANSESMRVRNF